MVMDIREFPPAHVSQPPVSAAVSPWRGAALVWGRCLLVSSVAPQPSTRQLPPTSTTNNYSDYFRFQLAVKYLKKL